MAIVIQGRWIDELRDPSILRCVELVKQRERERTSTSEAECEGSAAMRVPDCREEERGEGSHVPASHAPACLPSVGWPRAMLLNSSAFACGPLRRPVLPLR